MSQAGVARPASQLGGMQTRLSLPEIQHPMSRLQNPGDMDVRGLSRSGDRPFSQMSQFSASGRPLACEEQPKQRKTTSAAGRRESRLSFRKDNYAAPPIDSIPERVEVAHGDPNKPRIPIFGNRTSIGERDDATPPSRASSRLSASSTQARLAVDELESLLRDKVRYSYREIKKRFKDNDPEGKGNVTREAFSRIVMTLLNRPVGQSLFTQLLERLGLKDKSVISYTEFYSVFRVADDRNYPKWIDPVNRSDQSKMTASQVHTILKEKAKDNLPELADMIPQLNPNGRLLKPEFKETLGKMMIYLDDEEFDKLWTKYDTENVGVIKGEQLKRRLGVQLNRNSADSSKTKDRLTPIGENGDDGADKSPQRTPKKREIERKQQLTIERWLKDKFREGFFDMKEAFEDKDLNNSGLVSYDDFLEVLQNYGLNLDKSLLGSFLSRCSVKTQSRAIPYREFLHRFQDRSEEGMVHSILNEPKHRYNRVNSPTGTSTISAIESQLMNMFQRDFLALLATFKNIDKLGIDKISLEEFRAAVETRFNLELTDAQFDSFVDRLPLDEDGLVIYGEFMKQFDTKGKAPSLFMPKKTKETSPTNKTESPVEAPEPMFQDTAPSRRRTQEIFKMIKDLLNRRYQDVEKAFYDIDDNNTRRITQETMYHLLKRFGIEPEISRGEIRDLWKTFITNSDRTLDFFQFVRHFGFSLRSAAYPNAKIRPPQHGDADYMIRSRKLNSTRDLLEDHLRAKIEYLFDDLHREFQSMDLYSTGFISAEEFRDVLAELCVQLTDYELNSIVNKFNTRNDGRISYIDFLKPFEWKQQTWRYGNDMINVLNQPQALEGGETQEDENALHTITDKLRQQLSGDWKTLRRAFRKLDMKGDGLLSVPEFKSVLRLANVILDEDEVYHVMSTFDKGLSGKISYDQFIQETIRPGTRLSSKSAM